MTRDIHPSKAIGGGAFLVSCLISMNVKYCEPTVDLEYVFMNSALNYNGPSMCSLR